MNKKNYKKQYAKKASAGEGDEMLKQREQKQARLGLPSRDSILRSEVPRTGR